MRPKLELALLGPPQVWLAGQPLADFRTLKAQALLYYLAVTGHVHTRSSLANLLWGDMTESQARTNLSKALSELRAVVGEYVSIERQQIAFNQQSDYWLDLHDLEASLATILQTRSPAPDLHQVAQQLAQKIELRRGDFLAGFYVRNAPEFEMWMLRERGRQREQLVQGLQRLVDASSEQGSWQPGILFARHLLAIEPWHEWAHRQLIYFLACSGQRGAALAQFETCCRVLEEELSVVPDPELIALVEQIRSGGFVPPAPAVAPVIPPSLSASTQGLIGGIEPGPPPRFLDPGAARDDNSVDPFVARSRELTELERYLQRALQGNGSVVLVTGEAGSGKTALLQAFAQRALDAHPALVVAQGICNAYTGTGDPYLPFREILSMLAGQVEDRWAGGAIGRVQALRLWHLLPVVVELLLERGSNLIDTMVDGRGLLARAATYGLGPEQGLDRLAVQIARQDGQTLEQDRLFQQVGAMLQALARRAPLLLMLDDLHWADASSIALLFYLGRTIAQGPILVVGSYRPEEVAAAGQASQHPLADVVAEFRRQFGHVVVSLDERPEADARQFVDELLDTEPNHFDASFRRALLAVSRAHPLFTLELLRDMQERRVLVQDAAGHWVQRATLAWDTLPARVEGVIERRMLRLAPPLHDMLRVAAVEGEEFTAEVVARIQGMDDLQVVRSLAELDRTHRLVMPSSVEHQAAQRLSKYRFRHSLFQHYLYASLNAAERVYLHERVGSELERVYAGATESIAVSLGRHFEIADQTAKAIQYWLQAGDAAARLYAQTEAVASYRRGLALARLDPSHELLPRLFAGLGRALELDSQFEQALATYSEMEAMGADVQSRSMQLQALMAQATLFTTYNPLHDLARAERVSKQALTLAQELGDEAAEAKILGNMIMLYSYTRRWEEGIACGLRSIEIARRVDLPQQLALSLHDLGSHCYEVVGDLAQAVAVLDEARRLWQEQGNLPMLADNLATAAAVNVWEGDYAGALRKGEEALHISRTIENPWGQGYSQYKLGWVHWERGRADRALATMEETLALARRAGFGVPQVVTQADLALLYAESGESVRAHEAAQLALTQARTHGLMLMPYALGVLAHVLLLSGQLDEAEASLARAESEFGERTGLVYYVPAVTARALLSLRQETYRRAVEDARQLRRHSVAAQQPTAYLIEARALSSLGERDAALACLGEARQAAQRIGSRRVLWRILHLQSELVPDPAQAQRLRHHARRLVRTIAGYIPLAERRTSYLTTPAVRDLLEGTMPIPDG